MRWVTNSRCESIHTTCEKPSISEGWLCKLENMLSRVNFLDCISKSLRSWIMMGLSGTKLRPTGHRRARQVCRWHGIPRYPDIGPSLELEPGLSVFSGRTTCVLGMSWKELAGSSSYRH